MDKPDANGWVEWNPPATKKERFPFRNPVDPDVLVHVKFNTGERILGSRPAHHYRWSNIIGRHNIVAYRICR
jgi:hypothetical protein